VTIDLTDARKMPSKLEISAYAIFRDVDVIVPDGAAIGLVGGGSAATSRMRSRPNSDTMVPRSRFTAIFERCFRANAQRPRERKEMNDVAAHEASALEHDITLNVTLDAHPPNLQLPS
jgi:hypothetical protein